MGVKSRIIGIDLGTTNSVVAVFDRGAPRIIDSAAGARTTPSIVAFLPRGRRLVGAAARDQQVTNPTNTVYSIKRFMGRRRGEVNRAEKLVPYTIVGKPKEPVRVRIGRREHAPEEIAAMILRDIKATAERHLQTPVERAVISVPAHFDDAQRQATRDAAEIAGLDVERIINEPTAAAIAYGLESLERKRIVVLDFGGGTLDLAILEIGGGTFEVRAVDGATHLGGDDLDYRIIDIVADDFRRRNAIDLRRDPMALQRLKRAAEHAKIDLSSRFETTIELPFVCLDEHGPKHLRHVLSREHFEALSTDLFHELRNRCRKLLYSASLRPDEIDDVVMVGGSTRIPRVRAIAQEVFQRSRIDYQINPDEVVAAGAAILGGVIAGACKNVALMDVTTQRLGLETVNDGVVELLPKHAPVPASVSRVFTTPRDRQGGVPIRVTVGDGDHVEDVETLALFNFRGIERARRGKPRIEVRFDIDADGILDVTATDRRTGRSRKVEVRDAVGLRRKEIERMKRVVRKMEIEGPVSYSVDDHRRNAEHTFEEMTSWLEHNRAVMPLRAANDVRDVLRHLARTIKAGDARGMKSSLAKLRRITQTYRKSA